MPTRDRVDEIRAQWRRERPDLDTSPMALIGRLHRLAARLTTELTAVYQQYGLSEGEFDLLATLRREGAPASVTPTELAARTMVTTGAVTKRLDRLEAAGWVQRLPRDEDGRGRVVVLTKAGRDLVDEAFTAHMANEKRLTSVLTSRERTALERLLRSWGEGLDGGTLR
ncbi:MarR family winged helix-turn-helix transcriptional regulator [Jatrophihabitans sp. YIM 134969]